MQWRSAGTLLWIWCDSAGTAYNTIRYESRTQCYVDGWGVLLCVCGRAPRPGCHCSLEVAKRLVEQHHEQLRRLPLGYGGREVKV
jgi:hypothetical protein